MFSSFKKHLDDSNCGYFDHAKFAIYAGILLLVAGITSFIHALLLGFFKGTSAYVVIKLYNQRLKNHPNPLYQEWIRNANNN